MGNFLQKNTPLLGEKVYSVIQVLENKYHFIDILRELDGTKRVQVLIGEENLIPELESYTMIVKTGTVDGKRVFVGLL
jgi:transcriptional regulator of heat shock response